MKISQYSEENAFVGAYGWCLFLIKVYNFIKKKLQYSCFPVNIAKSLRIAFL